MVENDYVTANYYFLRILNSPKWEEYGNKVSVLGKLGIIEESQAHFEESSDYYRRLCEYLSAHPKDPKRNLYRFYAQRYAQTLERIGEYAQASKLYWDLLRKADGTVEPAFLSLLIRNYEFQKVSPSDWARLEELVIPKFMDQAGWDFAELYRIKEKYTKAREMYEMLWPKYPRQAVRHAESIYRVYVALQTLDRLLADLRQAHDKKKLSGDYLALEIVLLEHDKQPAQALSRLEDFFQIRSNTISVKNAPQIVGKYPTALIDTWVNLVEKQRGLEDAIRLLRIYVNQSPMESSKREKLSNLLYRAGRVDEAVQVWMDWSELQKSNPFAIFHAVEMINSMGDPELARNLLADFQNKIAPNIAYQHAKTALELGDYEQAFASFAIANASANVNSPRITNMIDQFAEKRSHEAELFQALLSSASKTIQTGGVEPWIRDPLLRLGIQRGEYQSLESLARADQTGRWLMYLAEKAQHLGQREWAIELLQSVPASSRHATSARLQLARLLSRDASKERLETAISLLKPSVEEILSETKVVVLTEAKRKRLFQYIELSIRGYQPAGAMVALRQIESTSATLGKAMASGDLDRLRYYRARALSQLSSLEPALELYRSLSREPWISRADMQVAKILLAQKKTNEAKRRLREIVENPNRWKSHNEALSLLTGLEPLVGDSLLLYCDSILYRIQGRFKDAIPLLRELAVNHYWDDMEEWARYTIAEMEKKAGDQAAARDEWKRLALDADHPILHGKTRMELLDLKKSAFEIIEDSTAYQDFLLDFSNTLFSDLVRLQSNR
ncbi:hypothetical protein GF373_15705 [bacterium]|nr:hypothetical protein [bacterium]